MSTPRRGIRRVQSQRRPGTVPPASRPKPPPQARVARATPVFVPEEPAPALWLQVLEWASWIVIWVFAIAAGWFLGKIQFSKVLFIGIMLAVTILPWLSWVRRGSTKRLAPPLIAGLQGGLAFFVALVLTLSGTYIWAAAAVVIELPLAVLVLAKTPRPRPAQS